MKNLYLLFIFTVLISSCKKKQADLIVVNANAYTVNSTFDNAEAFAVKDGKFIAVGTTLEIEEKYQSENILDAKNQTIVPGLIDAHCHFYRMGLQQQKVDLEGTASYDDVLQKLVEFQKEKKITERFQV